MNGRLMASCVKNICIKNYQNLVVGFQVTIKNVGDVLGTQCIFHLLKPCWNITMLSVAVYLHF